MPSILFVCTANQFRSPIAAACLLERIGHDNTAEKWRVESAGTWALGGTGVPDMTRKAAISLGLGKLEGHRALQIQGELLTRFDLVLVMENGHKEAICLEFPSICRRVHLLSEVVDGFPYDIPDPGNNHTDPAEVASILSDLIARGKDKILALAQSLAEQDS